MSSMRCCCSRDRSRRRGRDRGSLWGAEDGDQGQPRKMHRGGHPGSAGLAVRRRLLVVREQRQRRPVHDLHTPVPRLRAPWSELGDFLNAAKNTLTLAFSAEFFGIIFGLSWRSSPSASERWCAHRRASTSTSSAGHPCWCSSSCYIGVGPRPSAWIGSIPTRPESSPSASMPGPTWPRSSAPESSR